MYQASFLRHKCTCYREVPSKNVVVIGCAWQQSLSLAQERKAEKAGFTCFNLKSFLQLIFWQKKSHMIFRKVICYASSQHIIHWVGGVCAEAISVLPFLKC